MKVGAYVQSHIQSILTHAEAAPGELARLTDAKYCKSAFNLNWPFFARAGTLKPDEHTRYWRTVYPSSLGRLRSCSQWYEKDRSYFDNYLRSIGMDVGPSSGSIAVNVPEESRRTRQLASSTETATIRNSRYRSTHVGSAQNSLVRVILGHVGDEVFSATDWEETKRFFGNACAYCAVQTELQIDHAIPINLDMLGEHRLERALF